MDSVNQAIFESEAKDFLNERSASTGGDGGSVEVTDVAIVAQNPPNNDSVRRHRGLRHLQASTTVGGPLDVTMEVTGTTLMAGMDFDTFVQDTFEGHLDEFVTRLTAASNFFVPMAGNGNANNGSGNNQGDGAGDQPAADQLVLSDGSPRGTNNDTDSDPSGEGTPIFVVAAVAAAGVSVVAATALAMLWRRRHHQHGGSAGGGATRAAGGGVRGNADGEDLRRGLFALSLSSSASNSDGSENSAVSSAGNGGSNNRSSPIFRKKPPSKLSLPSITPKNSTRTRWFGDGKDRKTGRKTVKKNRANKNSTPIDLDDDHDDDDDESQSSIISTSSSDTNNTVFRPMAGASQLSPIAEDGQAKMEDCEMLSPRHRNLMYSETPQGTEFAQLDFDEVRLGRSSSNDSSLDTPSYMSDSTVSTNATNSSGTSITQSSKTSSKCSSKNSKSTCSSKRAASGGGGGGNHITNTKCLSSPAQARFEECTVNTPKGNFVQNQETPKGTSFAQLDTVSAMNTGGIMRDLREFEDDWEGQLDSKVTNSAPTPRRGNLKKFQRPCRNVIYAPEQEQSSRYQQSKMSCRSGRTNSRTAMDSPSSSLRFSDESLEEEVEDSSSAAGMSSIASDGQSSI